MCDNRSVKKMQTGLRRAAYKQSRFTANHLHSSGDPDFVQSLARGLRVIEAFERKGDALSVAQLALRTDLSRAVVRRLLITLELLGYATRDGAEYKLSPKLIQFGFGETSTNSIETLGLPIIKHVTQVLHESSSLGMLQGRNVVYIARSAAERVMSIGLSVGSQLPAYCTSIGRVLLAAMPLHEFHNFVRRAELKKLTAKTIVDKRAFAREIENIRAQGYSIVDEELEIGLRSIAVPVKTRSGKVVAAMNSGVNVARVSKQKMLSEFLPVLKEQAALLGSMLP